MRLPSRNCCRCRRDSFFIREGSFVAVESEGKTDMEQSYKSRGKIGVDLQSRVCDLKVEVVWLKL